LNANLDEKIYVQISIGDKIFKCGKSKLLQKALYGLKQVGRKWFHEISDFLKKIRLIINIIFFFFFFFFFRQGREYTSNYQYNTDNCLFGKYKK